MRGIFDADLLLSSYIRAFPLYPFLPPARPRVVRLNCALDVRSSASHCATMSETAKRVREAKVLTPNKVIARASAFVASNGRFPTSREDQVLHRKLTEMRAKRGKLAPAVAASLEAIPGWTWADAERPAELTARRLAAFVSENGGRYPGNTRTTPKEEVNLNKVVSKYRRTYATLPAEDRASFERVPGWSWAIAEKPAIGATTAKTPAAKTPSAKAAKTPKAKPAPRAKRAASRSPNYSPAAFAVAAAPAKVAKFAYPSRSPSYDLEMLGLSQSPEIARLRTEDLPSLGAYSHSRKSAASLRTEDLPSLGAYSRSLKSAASLRTEDLPSLAEYSFKSRGSKSMLSRSS